MAEHRLTHDEATALAFYRFCRQVGNDHATALARTKALVAKHLLGITTEPDDSFYDRLIP